jgi:hypothetical protein
MRGNVLAAYEFYKKFIYNREKEKLFKEYNFPTNGTVPPVDWEVFCAILFSANKKEGGCDLDGYEIKSAKEGNSFEYQYHKKSGLEKIREEFLVKHIYISYNNRYKDVVVRAMPGEDLKEKLGVWEGTIEENYQNGKQRCRKSLTYKFVCERSEIIMEIQGGSLKGEAE